MIINNKSVIMKRLTYLLLVFIAMTSCSTIYEYRAINPKYRIVFSTTTMKYAGALLMSHIGVTHAFDGMVTNIQKTVRLSSWWQRLYNGGRYGAGYLWPYRLVWPGGWFILCTSRYAEIDKLSLMSLVRYKEVNLRSDHGWSTAQTAFSRCSQFGGISDKEVFMPDHAAGQEYQLHAHYASIFPVRR